MKTEYLLFNLIVFIGPLALSFDRKVHFYTYWSTFLKAFFIPAALFILWDALVAGRHWWFNDLYTVDLHIFNLPPGEWLFFFTVPYACVFTWQVLKDYFEDRSFDFTMIYHSVTLVTLLAVAFNLYRIGFEYTGLSLGAFTVALGLDRILNTYLLRRKLFLILLALIIIFTLIFNGYLTARPVVLYDYSYQLQWLIGTIPTEDFIYGLSLMYMIVTLYEWQLSNSSRPS